MGKKKATGNPWAFSMRGYLNLPDQDQLDWIAQISEAMDLISISEAAQIRGVTTTAIHNLIKRGRLPSQEIAGELVVRKSDVEKFERGKPGRRPKGE